MPSSRTFRIFVVSIFATCAAAPAFAALSATAIISSVPNGSKFDYTITLTNTGTTNIGTFWFAWTPPTAPFEYDFLPSNPTVTGQPAGWSGPASPGFPGYSIEFYTLNTASQITPGNFGTFKFTSSDSPNTLKGNSILNFPILTSFIYAGQPEVGSFAQVTPVFAAPEPASIALLLVGSVALALRRRKII